MTRNAAVVALFPPLEPARVTRESDYDRGFTAGVAHAQSAADTAIAAIRAAFDDAQRQAAAEAAHAQEQVVEMTRRLLVACAPKLAARATLDALSAALATVRANEGPVSIRVAPDIAGAVRALGFSAAIEIDESLPVGAARARWLQGGLDSSPIDAIESVIALINQYADQGGEP